MAVELPPSAVKPTVFDTPDDEFSVNTSITCGVLVPWPWSVRLAPIPEALPGSTDSKTRLCNISVADAFRQGALHTLVEKAQHRRFWIIEIADLQIHLGLMIGIMSNSRSALPRLISERPVPVGSSKSK